MSLKLLRLLVLLSVRRIPSHTPASLASSAWLICLCVQTSGLLVYTYSGFYSIAHAPFIRLKTSY